MAEPQYRNGQAESADKTASVEEKDRVFPSWVNGPNLRFVIGIALTLGALAFLPASRGQLEAVKKENQEQNRLIEQRVEVQDRAISELRETVTRVESKIDSLLLRLTPSHPAEAIPSAPAVQPPKRYVPTPKRKTLGLGALFH